jgi:cytochrome P460
MRRIGYMLGVAIALAGGFAYMNLAPAHADGSATAFFADKIPAGYRDWKLISVAHEEGSLNDLRAVLGNDIAVKAYREGKLPFPDGAIVARLAWKYVPSEENNKAFGREQSFVAGDATNIQFMVNIFGIYLANQAEALKNWSGTGCDVKSVSVTDVAATMLSPKVGILTFKERLKN